MSLRFLGLWVSAAVVGLGSLGAACGNTEVPTRSAPPPSGSGDAGYGPANVVVDDAGTPSQDTSDSSTPPTPTPACAYDKAKAKYLAESLMLGSDKRTYHLFAPEPCASSKSRPLVVLFHGDGGNGESMRGLGFEDRAAGSAVFAYPDGPGQTWDLESAPADNNDYKFFDALLVDIAKKAPFDAKRVFVVGFSRGGFFVNQLGCFRGNSVRALVAQSGGGPYLPDGPWDDNGLFGACDTPPPAAMMIHGEADGVVPYDNGGVKSRKYWTAKDKCKTDTSPFAPSPCVQYAGCTAGHPVVWCSIPDMGHTVWSHATEASWKFLTQF